MELNDGLKPPHSQYADAPPTAFFDGTVIDGGSVDDPKGLITWDGMPSSADKYLADMRAQTRVVASRAGITERLQLWLCGRLLRFFVD